MSLSRELPPPLSDEKPGRQVIEKQWGIDLDGLGSVSAVVITIEFLAKSPLPKLQTTFSKGDSANSNLDGYRLMVTLVPPQEEPPAKSRLST